MVKKVFYLLIGLLLVSPLSVQALGGNLQLECDKVKVSTGGSATCSLSLVVTEGEVTSFNSSITFDTNFEVTFTKNSIWTGNDSTTIALTSTDAKTGTVSIGTVVIKAKSDAAFGDKTITFASSYIGDGSNTASLANKSQVIRILSNVNMLSDIKIDGTSLSNFIGTTTSYTYTTTKAQIVVSATKTDDNAVLYGDTGIFNLEYGLKTINIYVNSESGLKKTYTINITRNDIRSDDNRLKTLILSNGELSFAADTLIYNVDVLGSVDKVTITSTLNNAKASYVKNYGNRTVNLDRGLNVIEVSIKAENDTVRTYTLNITRADDRSSDINISNITVNSKSITLTTGVYEYAVTLKYKEATSNVVVTPNDANTKVDLENIDLVVGENVLTFKLVAENTKEQEYTIKITRLSEEASKVYLQKITVSGYEINFDTAVNSYDITLQEGTDKLLFTILPSDEAVTTTITGNENLKDGSVVTLKVTDDKGEHIYTFNIHEEKADLILGVLSIDIVCYIIFGFGCLLFLISIIYAIKKKKSYY